MTIRNLNVKIEVSKTIQVSIRRRNHDRAPWDWHTEERESSDYFETIEAALDDAEKVLSA